MVLPGSWAAPVFADGWLRVVSMQVQLGFHLWLLLVPGRWHCSLYFQFRSRHAHFYFSAAPIWFVVVVCRPQMRCRKSPFGLVLEDGP